MQSCLHIWYPDRGRLDSMTTTQNIQRDASSRRLLYIGAGTGKRVSELRRQGFEKLVLVEAEKSAAQALIRKTSRFPEVQVVWASIGRSSGETELRCWNLARLNAVHEPSEALRELFPGLRLKERQTVSVLSPAQVMAEMGELSTPLSVIIEDPGNELEILQAFRTDSLLEQIDQLEVLSSEEIFFDGGERRAVVEDWLLAEGFTVIARDSDDPDWTVLHLQADHAARALSKAETRLAEMIKEVAERDIALKAAGTKASDLEAELAAQAKALSERDAALKSVRERKSGLETQLAEAQSAVEAKARTIAERDAAVKAATEKAAGLEAQLAESRAAVEERTKTLAERDAALKAAQEKLAGSETRATEQTHRLTAARDELRRAEGQLDLISDLLLRGERL